MSNLINGVAKRASRFRPTSEGIVKGIRTTKRVASEVNAKHDGAVNYLFLGFFLAVMALMAFGTREIDLGIVSFSGGSLSLFLAVYSVVAWGFVKFKIWK